MGEKVGKTEDSKPAPAGDKKDAPAATSVVLKLDLHCEGCAKKVKRTISKNFKGVEEIKADVTNNKLTVTGKVDPTKLRQTLEEKLHKKVELISPLQQKDTGSDKKPADKKPDEKKPEEKKPDEKKTEEKKKPEENPKEVTVVLKMKLHCEGCIHKIKRVIKKYSGVKSVNFEADKDLIKVAGIMDIKALVPYLTEKFKRTVEIVPPKKESTGEVVPPKKDSTGDEKKVEKVDETKAVKVEEAKGVEVNKMEHYGFPYSTHYTVPSMPPNQGFVDHGYYDTSSFSNGYSYPTHGYDQYPNQMHQMQYFHPTNMDNTSQMFSDENPNASCSIM
ncbi:heavy metal-associated isoprenylated plant protein 6-like [Impatiens glandulifera]|uniref:heavy metal-associated isoprenylated plant protein 6-like n=1 Tax=Impatiens glandulifera TaxID=253017 RepID=UPI001FB06D33|nr:heavy metal-associated isoprenylated plant protein 6-like [Impatiens glandulifera]